MLQSLLEANTGVNVREFFRRPPQSNTTPLDWIDSYGDSIRNQKASGAGAQKAPTQLSKKVSTTVGKSFRCPLGRSQRPRTQAFVAYPMTGSNVIETVRYSEPRRETEKGLIWINQTQYFEGISPAVWNYSLGGQKICQKWLQDRQGCTLCQQSIQQYQRMVTIIKDVAELIAGIDGMLQTRQSRSNLSVAVSH